MNRAWKIAAALLLGSGANLSTAESDRASPSREQLSVSRLEQWLAEILVFSGEENVALRRPLRTSSNEPNESPAWDAS